MAAWTGGKAIVEALAAEQVRHVFGLIGSAGMEIFDALYDAQGIRFIGVRDDNRKGDRDDETVLGVSGNFGINYEFSRVDIFVQLTPRLEIISETDLDVGGGLGVRFFF